MLKEIGNRIKQLREEMGITQDELAKSLNVGRETVARWESGTRDIKTDATISIAKFFNVTTDYLLGLSDYKTFENSNIGVITGLSENNIDWLKTFIEEYSDCSNIAKRKFFSILNELLDTLREYSIIYTLMHLYAKMKMFKNAFKKMEKKVDDDKEIDIYEAVTLFSIIQNINDEKEQIKDILTYSLQNIIGYSVEEYSYYCNALSEYSVTHDSWIEDIENGEEFFGIEQFYRDFIKRKFDE